MKNWVKITSISLVLCLVLVFGLVRYLRRPIVVGFSGSLSGPWSQLAVDVRSGFDLAVREINSRGGIRGRRVSVVYFDDQGDLDTALQQQKLIRDQGIEFLVGYSISAMKAAVEAFLPEAEILILSPTMSTSELSGMDDMFFRVCSEGSEQGENLLSLIGRKFGGTVSVVYDTDNAPYTVPILSRIQEKASEYGVDLLESIPFNAHSVSFSDLARKIKEQDADNVIFLTSGIDAAGICQQLRIMNSDARFFGSAWATTEDLLINGGRAVEGFIASGLYDNESRESDFLDFKEKYTNVYKSDPGFPQVYGYEALMVLSEGIEKSGSFDPVRVKRAIIETENFRFLQQEFLIDEFGDCHRDSFFFRVVGGKFETFK